MLLVLHRYWDRFLQVRVYPYKKKRQQSCLMKLEVYINVIYCIALPLFHVLYRMP